MCYPTPGPRCSNHAWQEYNEVNVQFDRCLDPVLKTKLGVKLEEKLAQYYSTPRGQNDLRRIIAIEEDAIAKDVLVLALRIGEETRKQQIEAYKDSVYNHSSAFEAVMDGKKYSKGRYQDSAGVALLTLAENFPEIEFTLEGTDTVLFDGGKLLVLPEKYQKAWGLARCADGLFFTSFDELDYVLNKYDSYDMLPPVSSDNVWAWWKFVLEEQGYVGFVSVNRFTQKMVVAGFDALSDVYNVGLKLKKRLGGTTAFNGSVEQVSFLLPGTAFEGATVLDAGKGKIVVYGVGPQSVKDCRLGSELFLSYKHATEGKEPFFEVRRRHLSNKFDVVVCVKTHRNVDKTVIDDGIRALFV